MLGTNSKNKLQLWGSCQLAWSEFHGNEPPFICGCASLLMFVLWDSRPPPRCWTNWCQSQPQRGAPFKRAINEAEGTHIHANQLTRPWEVRGAPRRSRPACWPLTWPEELPVWAHFIPHQWTKEVNRSRMARFCLWDFLFLPKLNLTLTQEQSLQSYTCRNYAKVLLLFWPTTKNGHFFHKILLRLW